MDRAVDRAGGAVTGAMVVGLVSLAFGATLQHATIAMLVCIVITGLWSLRSE